MLRGMSMEPFDETASQDICKGFPRIIRIGASFPFDEILKLVSDTTRIQDIVDFEVFLVILDVKCRRNVMWSNWVWFDRI